MTPQNIELHIEKLVLHGFATKDRTAIGEAVQHELHRLLVEQGIRGSPRQNCALAQLEGGAFTMQPDASAQTIGTQIAQSVFKSLQQKGMNGV
jgi:hypothetical protein